MSAVPKLVVDNEAPFSVVDRRIRDSANYISKRIENTKAGEAWLDVGRELAELKVFVRKHSKHDSKRDGWYAAFGKGNRFPFTRRYADNLISLHQRLVGNAFPARNLPNSVYALIALAAVPESCRAQVAEQCSAMTTAPQVHKISESMGIKRTAKKLDPKRAFEARLKAFADAMKTLPKSQRIKQLRSLAIELEVGEIFK